jgi:universal stress protein E
VSASEKVLVVINPNRDSQPALERVAQMSRQAESQQESEYVFLVLANLEYVNREQDRCTVTQDVNWLVSINSQIDALNVKSQVLISWSSDWAQTLVDTIDEMGITFCVVPFYDKARSKLLSDERWQLLRKSKVAVLLAMDNHSYSGNKVLATLKSQDSDYDSRNAGVLEVANTMVQMFGSEIHVANAYADSMEFPDRAALAKTAATDTDKVHIKVGNPEDVICDVATEQDIDLVLIASQRRQGLKGRLRGNTVEKIVGKLECDIMMI